MKVTDPVCGMPFDSDAAAASAEHDGKIYYFCSQMCRQRFEQEPGRYIGASVSPDPCC